MFDVADSCCVAATWHAGCPVMRGYVLVTSLSTGDGRTVTLVALSLSPAFN
jgi:hypothetical protein